jgi:hypothetical protein
VIVGNTATCRTTNTIFPQYRTYFVNLGLSTFIPATVIIVFGFGTYRHLTMLTVFQSAAVLLYNGSYAIMRIYALMEVNVPRRTAYRQTEDQVLNSFLAIYCYGTYAV